MKLVLVSNFDREDVDDILLAENVNVRYADDIVQMWNAKYSSDTSMYYCQIKPDNYDLKKWEP